jgi:FlaA1/EpsC-like NDP-sugar epimerase
MFFNHIPLFDSVQQKARQFLQRYTMPRWLVFLQDNLAVFITFLIAYLLRYNLIAGDFSLRLAFEQAIITTSVYALYSLVFRSFTGLIRHTTIVDIFNVLSATTLSMATLLFISAVARSLQGIDLLSVPFSILLIHYVLITFLLTVIRIFIKLSFLLISSTTVIKKRILIYGAGDMGVIVKRALDSDIKSKYKVAGFIDDSRSLQGKKLNEIPVHSLKSITQAFVEKHNIGALIFAIEKFPADKKREAIQKALVLGLEILQTPAFNTWLDGQFHMNQVRKVNLNDLLGRDPIKLNQKQIGIGLSGKTILVTGAAGSIGSEIVRQLTRFSCKKLILIDQAETPMFHLANEMHERCGNIPIQLLVADVTHPVKMEQIFMTWHPEIVFHAAAYKHVPLMEENPHEAIRVNVGGTRILSQLAVRYGVKKFVMISTDKAVNPTNVMGASKRICELIIQAKSRQKDTTTQFVTTRFGNVLGSNGSVIPLFSKQIEAGGPITVTHPNITRYFMTIPEACELVMEAGFMGKGGEIYVFDMGKPVKIADLANQMIRFSGLIPEKDIKIEFTGLRPGEKLYEELLADAETTQPTHHPKIKIARVDHFNTSEVLSKIETLLSTLYTLSKSDLILHCMELVPEYTSHFTRQIDTEVSQTLSPEEDAEIEKLMQRFRTGNRS